MNKQFPPRVSAKELMANLPSYTPFEPEPIDYVMSLGLDFDIESQLGAVRLQLQRHNVQDEETGKEIKQLMAEARLSELVHPDYVDERYIDRIQDSIYESAALSMAAVGMMAPLMETLLYQCSLRIAREIYSDRLPLHERVRYAKGRSWEDCHLHIGPNGARRDIVAGFGQMAEALSILQYFPSDIETTLQALFAYRNKMFHHGLEWQEKERKAFSDRIHEENWPDGWFARATTGGEPWILYMTSDFIEHCLQTIDAIIVAFGNYIRDVRSHQ